MLYGFSRTYTVSSLLLVTLSSLCSYTDRLTGHGESPRTPNKPQPIATLAGHFIEDISVGAEHTLAVSSDGDVYAWGNNLDGQLGVGHSNAVRTPQRIMAFSGKNISKVFLIYHVHCSISLLYIL